MKKYKVTICVDYNSDPIFINVNGMYDSEELATAVGMEYIKTHDLTNHFCDIMIMEA